MRSCAITASRCPSIPRPRRLRLQKRSSAYAGLPAANSLVHPAIAPAPPPPPPAHLRDDVKPWRVGEAAPLAPGGGRAAWRRRPPPSTSENWLSLNLQPGAFCKSTQVVLNRLSILGAHAQEL